MSERLVLCIILVLVHPWLNGHAPLKWGFGPVVLIRGAPFLPIFVNSCSQLYAVSESPCVRMENNYFILTI